MNDDVRFSKRLSLWLRHKPEAGGIRLDAEGWAETPKVLATLERAGLGGGEARLRRVVRESDKQRFELSEDGGRIRARQGHSVEVELGWWQTAVQYQMWHALALVALGLGPVRARTVGWLLGAGILLFSGSLYLMALTGIRAFAILTPLGGLLLILGWAALALAAFRGR